MVLVQTTRFGSVEAVHLEVESMLAFAAGAPSAERCWELTVIQAASYRPLGWFQATAEPAASASC